MRLHDAERANEVSSKTLSEWLGHLPSNTRPDTVLSSGFAAPLSVHLVRDRRMSRGKADVSTEINSSTRGRVNLAERRTRRMNPEHMRTASTWQDNQRRNRRREEEHNASRALQLLRLRCLETRLRPPGWWAAKDPHLTERYGQRASAFDRSEHGSFFSEFSFCQQLNSKYKPALLSTASCHHYEGCDRQEVMQPNVLPEARLASRVRLDVTHHRHAHSVLSDIPCSCFLHNLLPFCPDNLRTKEHHNLASFPPLPHRANTNLVIRIFKDCRRTHGRDGNSIEEHLRRTETSGMQTKH